MTEAECPSPGGHLIGDICVGLIRRLTARAASLAVAESVTGGRLTAALTGVPGSSTVVRGAVVAYASSVKVEVLGVDPEVLAAQGPVSAEVALQMADGVRRLLGTTYAVATTGEAGPDSASGQPVGTVYVAASAPGGTEVRVLTRPGAERATVQEAAVLAGLELLFGVIER